jgi:hypothetical protein
LTVFEELHALESGTTSNDFVREFSLVVIATAAIHFLVGILSVVWFQSASTRILR